MGYVFEWDTKRGTTSIDLYCKEKRVFKKESCVSSEIAWERLRHKVYIPVCTLQRYGIGMHLLHTITVLDQALHRVLDNLSKYVFLYIILYLKCMSCAAKRYRKW